MLYGVLFQCDQRLYFLVERRLRLSWLNECDISRKAGSKRAIIIQEILNFSITFFHYETRFMLMEYGLW